MRPAKGLIKRLKQFLETLCIVLADILTLLLSLEASIVIRKNVLPLVYPRFPEAFPFGILSINTIWIFSVWLFLFYHEGLYTRRFSFWDEVKALWKSAFFSSVGIFTIVSLGKLGDDVSRTVIVLMCLTSSLLFPVSRAFVKRLMRRYGLLKRRVLVLGAGQTGRLILKALRREPNYGYEVVGFLDDDPAKVGTKVDGVKVHRGVDKAGNYLRACDITDLFIAMPGAGRERLEGLINRLQHKVERVVFVPDMFGMAVVGSSLQHFFHEQAFAIEVKNNLARPLNVFVKRSFDFLVGGTLFLIFGLPMALLSIVIRLDSRGPAVFAQERVGKKGRTFMCYKFRTMHLNAEDRLQAILGKDETARNEWERHWKLREDPRVTRIGRFLRKTSLDELPQLMNVMLGHMSLVGPRPYLPSEASIIGEDLNPCLDVLPGITGLWQVSGRSAESYSYRVALDTWYVRNWNLWLDVVILLKTVRVVTKMEGAF